MADKDYKAFIVEGEAREPQVMCINNALVQFGFRGGNVLEPSMGVGNFFGSMPTPM